uniref:Uncharacterized protein n=1 Tax=Heterorhabditis bacteriophora TaxID=37862 RepID=A0A1I7XJE8_HETBA
MGIGLYHKDIGTALLRTYSADYCANVYLLNFELLEEFTNDECLIGEDSLSLTEHHLIIS